jgi:hypothetical protein
MLTKSILWFEKTLSIKFDEEVLGINTRSLDADSSVLMPFLSIKQNFPFYVPISGANITERPTGSDKLKNKRHPHIPMKDCRNFPKIIPDVIFSTLIAIKSLKYINIIESDKYEC